MKKYAYLLAASALVATGAFATVAPAQARDRVDFSISLGNVAIAYYDGYYDDRRRWHRWHNQAQRNWYRRNHSDSYFHMRRMRDRDQYRRDWWAGRRADWRRGTGVDFSIQLGNVVFAYEDGYYDRNRRWHTWQNDSHRDWYRRSYPQTYYSYHRARDTDRYRRDWWEGRRNDWRYSGNNSGVDFSIQLGNVVFAYEDGYYDRNRRWHTWQNDSHRDWYRRSYPQTYYSYHRDRDTDRYRRDWWEGRRNDWRYSSNDGGADFSIMFGNVVFAYEDGYYDRERRWHTWQNDGHRDWYRRHHSGTYYNLTRDRDDHRKRRDWREGRGSEWRDNDDHL